MKKWFTLIELVIVITIIWVLITVWTFNTESIQKERLTWVVKLILQETKQLKNNAQKWVTTQNNEKFSLTDAIYDWLLKAEYEAQRWNRNQSVLESKNSLIWQNSFYYALIFKPWKNYFKYVELEQEWCDTRRNDIVSRMNWTVTSDSVRYIDETVSLSFQDLLSTEWNNVYASNFKTRVDVKTKKADLIKKCFVSDRDIPFDEEWRVYLNQINFNDWEANAIQNIWWNAALVVLVQAWDPSKVLMFKDTKSSWQDTKINSLFINNFYDDTWLLPWQDIEQLIWKERNFAVLWTKYENDYKPLKNVWMSFSRVANKVWTDCNAVDFTTITASKPFFGNLWKSLSKKSLCITLNDKELNTLVENTASFK